LLNFSHAAQDTEVINNEGVRRNLH